MADARQPPAVAARLNAWLMRDLPSTGVVETANAVLVSDRDYFNAFDVEDEEDDRVIQAAE